MSVSLNSAMKAPPIREGTAVALRSRRPEREPFVLDLAENPHPRLLGEALLARASAYDSPQAMAYWLGYRAAMCAATSWPVATADAWLDHHEDDRAVPGDRERLEGS